MAVDEEGVLGNKWGPPFSPDQKCRLRVARVPYPIKTIIHHMSGILDGYAAT